MPVLRHSFFISDACGFHIDEALLNLMCRKFLYGSINNMEVKWDKDNKGEP